jgi:hypothetical protein
MDNTSEKNKKYFGAANGFCGFRSNFGEIFSPRRLDKIFIIKGGPGTGKSSFMRRVKEELSSKMDVTEILCSSDPNSLDGILIGKNEVTIGIADGTAPHTMDAEYPGAVEEIVNLGEAFDFKRLSENKTDIFDLSDNKKRCYSDAYSSLKVAGLIYENITAIYSKNGIYDKAESAIKEFICDEIPSAKDSVRTKFLIGAFCKNGYVRLDSDMSKRKVLIKGDGISEYIVMSKLKDLLLRNGIYYKTFSSAFSDKIYDGIETEQSFYTISDSSQYTLDTTQFIPRSYEYEQLKTSYRSMLESAQLSLIKASEYHFKMESIYSSSIDFRKNNEKCDTIIEKINVILNK